MSEHLPLDIWLALRHHRVSDARLALKTLWFKSRRDWEAAGKPTKIFAIGRELRVALLKSSLADYVPTWDDEEESEEESTDRTLTNPEEEEGEERNEEEEEEEEDEEDEEEDEKGEEKEDDDMTED